MSRGSRDPDKESYAILAGDECGERQKFTDFRYLTAKNRREIISER